MACESVEMFLSGEERVAIAGVTGVERAKDAAGPVLTTVHERYIACRCRQVGCSLMIYLRAQYRQTFMKMLSRNVPS